MDQHSARVALQAVAVRMPGAPADGLVGPAVAAWNSLSTHQPAWADRAAAVLDVAWGLGYQDGARQGHASAAAVFHETALTELARVPHQGGDRAGQQLLWAVAGEAQTIATQASTCTDPGPSHHDYRAAGGDTDLHAEFLTGPLGIHPHLTAQGRLAEAVRVGWTHGQQAGRADAAWSAAGAVTSAVTKRLGADRVRAASVTGLNGLAWLDKVDRAATAAAQSPTPREQAGNGASVRAFPQLTSVAGRTAATAAPPRADCPSPRTTRAAAR